MKSEKEKQMLHGKEIASLWFNHNDQNTYNSVKVTQDFLKKAAAKAKKEGFINVRVRPTCHEGDENNLESYYILVVGDRLETDEEFKKRMRGEYIRERERRRTNQREYDYFNSETGRAAIAELEKFK